MKDAVSWPDVELPRKAGLYDPAHHEIRFISILQEIDIGFRSLDELARFLMGLNPPNFDESAESETCCNLIERA
jgi:hypothetical protein